MKRIVKLLFVAFVVISAIVAFVPSITGIGTSGLTGITAAAMTVAEWLLPLAAVFIVVMLGVSAFSRRKKRGGLKWSMRGYAVRGAFRRVRGYR